jgi:hypothetical protein
MPAAHSRSIPSEDGMACLDALAAEVTARGWTAYITTPRDRPARLFVQNPHDRVMCADVMAAPDGDGGGWWFWFGWAERIAPTGTPGAAATVIINELRRQPDIRWDRRPSASAASRG